MTNSPVFDHVCESLDDRTDLDRLAARGTVRIALKSAGLDVGTVDAKQMGVVIARVLPSELESRGIGEATSICEAIAASLESQTFDVASDRADIAANALARFDQ